MRKIYLNKKNNFVYGVFPYLDPIEDCVEKEISEEEFEKVSIGKRGHVWQYIPEENDYILIENFSADDIRFKRKALLAAFDTYKSNVSYGVKTEDASTHQIIIEWYNKLLDVNMDAIRNIPEEIKYYL